MLVLPGWLDSGPAHWQSRWCQIHGFEKVDQADWTWPRRGDWQARLDEVVQADERPLLLVAHSLGCHLVAAWAAHSAQAHRVSGALLVAPPDTERPDMPPQLANWRPMIRQRLPFAATAVVSSNDPFCAPQRAAELCRDWGAACVDLGDRGHLNADSGLGDWPAGLELLELLARP